MAVLIQIQETIPRARVALQRIQSYRLSVAMIVSSLLHGIVLLGITFSFPSPRFDKISSSLEVALVNHYTQNQPKEAKLLAQDNLDGGGNTNADRNARTPLPVLPRSKPATDESIAQQKVKQLEQEMQKLIATVNELPQIQTFSSFSNKVKNIPAPPSDTTESMLQSLDIAQLKAQIDQDYDDYQKRPKRKFIGARTKEYRFARYVEDWRIEIERIGNLNYPETARREKIHGDLQLTVGIRADGSLESIEINRSSGKKVLDEAAIRIVRLAGQNGFAPFPPDIRQDTDILHITRTWVFASTDTLLSH